MNIIDRRRALMGAQAAGGEYTFVQTLTVSESVSYLDITIPEGKKDVVLFIDLTLSSSTKLNIQHGGNSSSQHLLGASATTTTISSVQRIIEIPAETVNNTSLAARTAGVYQSGTSFSSTVIMFAWDSYLKLAPSAGTIESGTVTVYAR